MEIHCYPKHYIGPKPIKDQIDLVAELFNLNPIKTLEYVKNLPSLPEGAEGWFAIPNWKKIATDYDTAVLKTLELIKQSRSGKFYNYLDDQFKEKYLNRSRKTVKSLQTIEKKQISDIFVIPAQFGYHHRNRSVRRARQVMKHNEFGLGVFEAGVMLLTHPERLANHHDLRIDCAGDEIGKNNFIEAPFFGMDYDELKLSTGLIACTNKNYGSATGFFINTIL